MSVVSQAKIDTLEKMDCPTLLMHKRLRNFMDHRFDKAMKPTGIPKSVLGNIARNKFG